MSVKRNSRPVLSFKELDFDIKFLKYQSLKTEILCLRSKIKLLKRVREDLKRGGVLPTDYILKEIVQDMGGKLLKSINVALSCTTQELTDKVNSEENIFLSILEKEINSIIGAYSRRMVCLEKKEVRLEACLNA